MCKFVQKCPRTVLFFSHNRYPHNYYCLQRRAAELAGASTQTLLTVGFGGLQHMRGEDEEGSCLMFVALSARINLHLFLRYVFRCLCRCLSVSFIQIVVVIQNLISASNWTSRT